MTIVHTASAVRRGTFHAFWALVGEVTRGPRRNFARPWVGCPTALPREESARLAQLCELWAPPQRGAQGPKRARERAHRESSTTRQRGGSAQLACALAENRCAPRKGCAAAVYVVLRVRRASGGRPGCGFSAVTPKFEWSTKTRNGKTFCTSQTHQQRQAEDTVAEGWFRRPGLRESLLIGGRKRGSYAY